jgi:hypothetical protein
MAEVLIKYKADAGDLEATVNKINEVNNEAVKSAQKASDKIATEYKDAAKSAAAAFSGGEVKKAIEGNTTALERLTKSGKSLTGQLRGLKAELTLLEQQGKDNTKEFNQLLIAASKLEDQIGDTRARVKILASDTFKFDAAVQATQGLAAGFEVAQGAAALFGSESEDLQKAILKVQGAIAVANGVQQIANLLLEESAIKTAVLTGAQRVYTFVTNGATVATKLWRAALVATGIGALIALIGTLASSFLDTAEATDDAAESARNYQKAIDDLNKSAQQSAVKAGNAQIELLQKQNRISEDAAKRLIAFNELQTGLSDLAISTKEKEAEAFKRFEEQKAEDLKSFGKVTKTTQDQLSNDLKTIEQQRINTEKELRAQNKIALIEIDEEVANKRKEAAKKAADAEKKELEELEKARKDLLAKRVANQKAANDSIAAAREADLQEELQAVAVADNASFALKIESLEKQKAIEIAAAEEAGQLTYEIEKKYAEQIAALKRDQAQSEINTRINTLRALEVAEGSTLDRRIELIEEQAKAQKLQLTNSIKDETERASAIVLLETETQQAIRDERKKSADEQLDQFAQIAEATADLFSNIIELQGIQSQKRIEEINAASEQEQLAIEQSATSEADKQRKLDALRLRTAQKVAAERRKQAAAEKAAAIFEATIGTAVAVAKAPDPVQKAIALAAGLAQIAIIAATPIPKFKRGGMVGGQSHEAGGTLIEAERGEFVVNRNSVSRHRSELDALNTSSAAFRRLIDERYVRPALNYYMGKKDKGVIVNASLNSKGMEKKLDRLNKTMSKQRTIVNINGNDSRYSWHLN